MKKLIIIIIFLFSLIPSIVFAAPICGKVYGPPTQSTVVNDYITGENGTDIERITSRSGPYTLCGAPSYNPYWIGSDQVRWYWLEGDSCPYDRYYTFYYTSGGSCTSSCSDGVINQDETDYDIAGGECGGVCGDCTPLEPVECSDGVISGNESGIDCGGDCLDNCIEFCPEDWINLYSICYSPEVPMIAGICPEGSTGQNITEQTCLTSQPALFAFPDYSEIIEGDAPSWVFTDDNSTWVSGSSVSVVDNGDGTSTETIIDNSTVNNTDGSVSSSTSTTTNIINNTSGDLVSSSTTGTDTGQIATNGTPALGVYDGSLIEGDDYPTESIFSEMLDTFSDGVGGVGTALGDSEMVIVDPVCSLTAEVWGASTIDVFNVCDEPYTGWFNTFRLLILAFAYLSAIYIVFRR